MGRSQRELVLSILSQTGHLVSPLGVYVWRVAVSLESQEPLLGHRYQRASCRRITLAAPHKPQIVPGLPPKGREGASPPQTQVAVSIREIEEDGMMFSPLLRHHICISYERSAPRRYNTSRRVKSVTGRARLRLLGQSQDYVTRSWAQAASGNAEPELRDM